MTTTSSAALPPARPDRIDPALADRVMDAVHLAGLPIAHGGSGPGVHLRPAQPLTDTDLCDGQLALHWVPSRRLADAAATEQHRQPAAHAHQRVIHALQHALETFLPALGATTTRCLGWEVRVPAADPLPEGLNGALLPRPTRPEPIAPGIRPDIIEAVHRAAALAGLPVALCPADPGITLRPCPPLDLDDDTTGIPDLGWNPSRRLTAVTTGRTAWSLRTAIEDAMRKALPTALGACGLEVWWRQPEGLPGQLRSYGPTTPPIRR
ncbi:hypothetical protein [Kitasatospora griseola]|uniref:hypothetical protein n=1 Tax=Kitasatospora griseola TaxID=2064 RepID=UPI003441DADB